MMFFGKTEKGKLILSDKKIYDKFIARLKDSVVEVRIRKWRPQRTSAQNRLYWMWLGIISNDLGYDPEELHTTFKGMFLIDRTKKLPLIRSTTVLNKLEFIKYLDKIEIKVGELGIVLPHPPNKDE